jgi:hypothetical protein
MARSGSLLRGAVTLGFGRRGILCRQGGQPRHSKSSSSGCFRRSVRQRRQPLFRRRQWLCASGRCSRFGLFRRMSGREDHPGPFQDCRVSFCLHLRRAARIGDGKGMGNPVNHIPEVKRRTVFARGRFEVSLTARKRAAPEFLAVGDGPRGRLFSVLVEADPVCRGGLDRRFYASNRGSGRRFRSGRSRACALVAAAPQGKRNDPDHQCDAPPQDSICLHSFLLVCRFWMAQVARRLPTVVLETGRTSACRLLRAVWPPTGFARRP